MSVTLPVFSHCHFLAGYCDVSPYYQSAITLLTLSLLGAFTQPACPQISQNIYLKYLMFCQIYPVTMVDVDIKHLRFKRGAHFMFKWSLWAKSSLLPVLCFGQFFFFFLLALYDVSELIFLIWSSQPCSYNQIIPTHLQEADNQKKAS